MMFLQDTYDYFSLPLMLLGIYSLMAMGLQLILGGAGLLSLGHAIFFCIGGYTSAIISSAYLPLITDSNLLQLILSALCAFLVSGFFAFFMIIPCLRLKENYFAMATLALGEVLSTVIKNLDFTGGIRGFKDIPSLDINPLIVGLIVLIVYLVLRRFYKSSMGYIIRATRDDDIAVQSLGISHFKSQIIAFTLGSAIAGMGGGFYAHTIQFMSPEEGSFNRSVEILLAVVIGGMNSLTGSLIGSLVIVAIPEILRFGPSEIAQNRNVFFASAVILLMLFRPKGLIKHGS